MRFFLLLILFAFKISAAHAYDFVFTPLNVSHGLSDNQIRYILQLPDGRMCFTTNGNVNIYNGSHFTYIHRTSKDIYHLSDYDGSYRIYQSKDSLLWIKDSHKLMCIDLKIEKYITELESYFRNKGIQLPITNLFVDSQFRIWLLTEKGLLQPDNLLSLDISENRGSLQDIDCDDTYLYLFYNTGEVACYDLKAKQRLYSIAAYPPTEEFAYKNTSLVIKGDSGFYQLRNGHGNKGGFFFFDTEKRRWKKLLETNYTLNTLIVTPSKEAYISTGHGIWIVDTIKGDKHYVPSLRLKNGSVIDTEISTLFYDVQGGFWIGTLNQGLLYHHPSRYKLKYVGRSSFPQLPIREIVVQSFAEDDNRNIYIKCQSGYYQYIPHDKRNVLSFVQPSSLSQSVLRDLNKKVEVPDFNGKSYTSICTDSRGWTWAGTPDGLHLFKSDGAENIFYTEDGLVNNFIHAIMEDSKHTIWVTTSYGISQIQVDTIDDKIHFTNYNSYEGALDGEYVNSSIFESSDGTLHFGGIDGFNILNVHSRQALSYLSFKPIFTSFSLNGEEVKTGKMYDGRIVLNMSTVYTQDIQLSHNQNFLTFEFSALNYRNQMQTYYRYMLEGLDTNWNEQLANNGQIDGGLLRISYTNLSPGKYNLKVMASDIPRQWNGKVSEVYIVIHAPWWKTTTAYIIYILFFIMLISSGVYFYIRLTKKKLERQHKEELLLLRIRNLIEQLHQYESGPQSDTKEEKMELFGLETEKSLPDNNIKTPEDISFLSRAMEMVEKNLETPGYSVEQLSRDLCMDRTGLYRKLTNLLDESPSLFIRNIRLQHVAQLILDGQLNITEIAEKVGFSSTSYMSKCFQEMYGCRPSEYVGKIKKST